MFKYKYDELIEPTLTALKQLGGSASNDEITDKVIEILNLSDEEINEIHKGSTTKLVYRLAWARTYLKSAGLIVNSFRGVWVLTDEGNKVTKVDKEMVKKIAKENMLTNKNNTIQKDNEKYQAEDDDGEIEELTWQNEIIELIKNASPNQFEKLCQRLLRELGFKNVEVTGRSHDGGIDGKVTIDKEWFAKI